MQTILLAILHWLYSKRINIFNIFKGIVNDDKIKLDGKISKEEFREYLRIFVNSGKKTRKKKALSYLLKNENGNKN